MITLQQPTLLLESDRTRLLPLLMIGDRTLLDGVIAEVRRYANGSTRLVRRAGRARSVKLTVHVDAAGLAELRAFAGQLLLYRDGLGTKMWCTYTTVEYAPNVTGSRFTVPLVLDELTFSEAV